jgi:aminoglycoside phosphotransferase (APT) family kinase protein
MPELGPLLASGRDADIFEYGATQVLRRSRNARSMVREARIMEFVQSLGYPIPRVDQVSEDGTELIMEKISGVNMVDGLTAAPWKARRFGRMLAELHVQLHELSAPEWLPAAPCGVGSQLLHMDLHPLNVMMSSRGPIVIDWTNAARGDPNIDVVLTWALICAGEVPSSGVKGKLTGLIRSRLVRGFAGSFDRDEVARDVDAVVEWKSKDPNLTGSEVASMRAFAQSLITK